MYFLSLESLFEFLLSTYTGSFTHSYLFHSFAFTQIMGLHENRRQSSKIYHNNIFSLCRAILIRGTSATFYQDSPHSTQKIDL